LGVVKPQLTSSYRSSTGIVFIICNPGQIAAFPFCGLLADGFGRKTCIFVGYLIVLIDTAVQGSCHTLSVFTRGRFILGFGAALAPRRRTSIYCRTSSTPLSWDNGWPLQYILMAGNILAGWTTYGPNLNLNNSWAWRTPTIAHNCLGEALAIFAKYRGDGDEKSPIVRLQYHEIVEQMNLTRNENPWWDFRELVNTRAARYRLCIVIGMSFFGQWSGNNVIPYFMVSDSAQPAER